MMFIMMIQYNYVLAWQLALCNDYSMHEALCVIIMCSFNWHLHRGISMHPWCFRYLKDIATLTVVGQAINSQSLTLIVDISEFSAFT